MKNGIPGEQHQGKAHRGFSLDPLRFLRPHAALSSTFGGGWFGEKAEAFARFFGTPVFLGCQTVLVILWISCNALGIFHFDLYPFILLNLAFSVQAAYSAPLILLAQTRQADRDKASSIADAQHREELAEATRQRQELAEQNLDQLLLLVRQNTELTEITRQISQRIAQLTAEVHAHITESQRDR